MAETKKADLRPDEQYLIALQAEAERVFGPQDVQIDDLRAVRQRTKRVAIPDDLRLVDIEVRDPTISDEAQRVVANLTRNPPTLAVKHFKQTDANTQNATLREKFSMAVIKRAGSREPGPWAFARIADACANDGGAWGKFLFRKDRWEHRYKCKRGDFQDDPEPDRAEDESDDAYGERRKKRRTAAQKYDEATEDAKRRDVPFDFLAVDVRMLYPFFEGDGSLREVLEVQRRPKHQVFRQYRLMQKPDGAIVPDELGQAQSLSDPATSASADCLVLEHWNRTWVTYCIVADKPDGKKAAYVGGDRQWKHGYGRPPYFFAPGLWHGGHWRNRKIGEGISESKKWLVENSSYLRTIVANVAIRDAMPPMFREVPDGAAPYVGKDNKPTSDGGKWGLGKIINGRPGEKMSIPSMPGIADALKEYLALNDEAIRKLDTPRVPAEIGGGLEGAGFAITTVLTEIMARYSPIIDSIESMLNEVTSFMWHLIRTKVKEDVWVKYEAGDETAWLKAGPDDLKDDAEVKWTLDPMLPSSKLVDDRLWHDRLAKGTAGPDEVIEASGRNPDEVRRDIDLFELRQTPWYKKAKLAAMLAEAQRGDLFADAFDQQIADQVAQQGGVMPGGPQGAGLPGMPQDMAALAASPGGFGVNTGGTPGGTPGAPAGGPVPPVAGQQAAYGAVAA